MDTSVRVSSSRFYGRKFCLGLRNALVLVVRKVTSGQGRKTLPSNEHECLSRATFLSGRFNSPGHESALPWTVTAKIDRMPPARSFPHPSSSQKVPVPGPWTWTKPISLL